MAGTMTFAISGIRLAATKRFDLFGAYVVGLVTAIGGGTIRDVMLDFTPFWLEDPLYLILTAIALLLVIISGRYLLHFNNTFFIFDTLGLALFTMVGIDKTIGAGFPIWAAVLMGMMTGCFGGVLRDMLVGDVPLLFRRDIYALASLLGGGVYALLALFGANANLTSIVVVLSVIVMRLVAVRFQLHLPALVHRGRGGTNSKIAVQLQRDRERRR